MINYFYRQLKDNSLSPIDTFKKGSWVVVTDPTPQEIDTLVDKFELERGHLVDSLDLNEVPRLEYEGQIAYVFMRTIEPAVGNPLATSPILIIVAQEAIITVSRLPVSVFSRLLQPESGVITTQKVKLLISLIIEIDRAYNQAVTWINRQVQDIVPRIETISNKDIITLVSYETILNEYLNALVRTNAMLKTLLSGKKLKLYDYDRDLVEDLFLSSGQLIDISKNCLLTARNSRDSYTSILTNNLNRVIKFFTSLTIILTIPTIVSSFFGMNVLVPGSQHSAAFIIIVTLTLIVCLLLVYIFNKKDWL